MRFSRVAQASTRMFYGGKLSKRLVVVGIMGIRVKEVMRMVLVVVVWCVLLIMLLWLLMIMLLLKMVCLAVLE